MNPLNSLLSSHRDIRWSTPISACFNFPLNTNRRAYRRWFIRRNQQLSKSNFPNSGRCAHRSRRPYTSRKADKRITPTGNVHHRVRTPLRMNWTRRSHLYARRSQSLPERTSKRHTSRRTKVRIALDICSVQCPAQRERERERDDGGGVVVCLPSDVRTVSRVRARETESYREWRVPGEISKFPFNGIIKRNGGARERGPVTTWHSVNSRESPGVARLDIALWILESWRRIFDVSLLITISARQGKR